MDTHIITRNAIGRIANFGDIYDARTDQFCSGSVVRKEIPASALKDTTKSTFKVEHLVEDDTFSEKFEKMDVCPDLQISILSRLTTKHNHSGRYLVTHKRSAREVKCSVIGIVKQRDEVLDFESDRLSYFIRTNPKEIEEGTHVVVGITQGARCVFSFTLRSEDQTKSIQQQIILSSYLKKVLSHTIIETMETDNYLNKMLSGVRVTLYSDIAQLGQNETWDFFDYIQLLKSFPLLAPTDLKPVVYKLVPMSSFFNEMKIPITCPVTYYQLHSSFPPRIVELFERMLLDKQEFHDYSQDVAKFTYCVPEEHVSEVSALQNNLTSHQTCFQQNLAQVITSIRSATLKELELDTLIANFDINKYTIRKLLKNKTSWDEAQQKIEFAKKVEAEEAKYIGNRHTLCESDFMESQNQSVVFYLSHDSKAQSEEWNDNCHIFFERLKMTNVETNYYVVDCDFHKKAKPDSKSSCIRVYKGHKIIINDMLEYRDRDCSQKMFWVQFLSEAEDVLIEPKKLGPLAVICPCKSQELQPTKNWHCTICFEPITYDFDGMLYCDCGKTPARFAEFKCPTTLHGKIFQRHPEGTLSKYLEQTVPFSETNLLILGETGVGKSTWINSFVNFLTYESLAEAERGGLYKLIPTMFTVYDENYQPTSVCTGFSENETFQEGQSATQQSKIYKFQIGTEIIRLIDTPGIGDTRGIENDKENFQNILHTIANLHDIHGICILLKPNNSRISVVFRFCIKELLTNLHRDASKNIVFCFTNSRETLYRPGDTMPALQELLRENQSIELLLNQQTVYCFDSEAYRFLAAVVNDPPVKFKEDHKSNFEKSWEESLSETKRMLSYINSLRPHKTTSTLNLNHARELVVSLTRPLAEISRNILTNRIILEQELDEIEDTESVIEQLEKRRYTTVTDIKLTQLYYPKTVCANSKCVKFTTIGDKQTIEYTTICHARCKLAGVTGDIIGHPLLMKCVALMKSNGTQCDRCEHPYNEHVHIYYDSEQVSVEVEDQSVIEALDKGLDAAQMKQNMISKRKAKIMKFEEELMEIEKASVKFACFLKCNAITPYNDGMEQYLKYLIRQEKDKVAQNGNPQVLQRLELSLESYLEERKILEEAMTKEEDNAKVLNTSDVEKLVNNLKQLELSGVYLKEALECVDKTRAAVFQDVQAQKSIRTKNKGFLSWAARQHRPIND